MPHHPDDALHPHLPLIIETENPQRRKQQVKQPLAARLPDRGPRRDFANQLESNFQRIENEARSQSSLAPTINPHLVFRIPVASKDINPLVTKLPKLGVSVVGIEATNAIIAFKNDADLLSFRDAAKTYGRGPVNNPKTGEPYQQTQWDVLQLIEPELLARWSPADRIGPRLANDIGTDGSNIVDSTLYVLDVELWHQGTKDAARKGLQELREAVLFNAQSPNERVTDDFVGHHLCLARINVFGAKLRQLLDLPIIAEVELPPVASFDVKRVREVNDSDFPTPPAPLPNGPKVCILDSGVAARHPLLRNNVGHSTAILTGTDTASRLHSRRQERRFSISSCFQVGVDEADFSEVSWMSYHGSILFLSRFCIGLAILLVAFSTHGTGRVSAECGGNEAVLPDELRLFSGLECLAEQKPDAIYGCSGLIYKREGSTRFAYSGAIRFRECRFYFPESVEGEVVCFPSGAFRFTSITKDVAVLRRLSKKDLPETAVEPEPDSLVLNVRGGCPFFPRTSCELIDTSRFFVTAVERPAAATGKDRITIRFFHPYKDSVKKIVGDQIVDKAFFVGDLVDAGSVKLRVYRVVFPDSKHGIHGWVEFRKVKETS